MESEVKACIINASIGAWYPKAQERLKRSLIYHGFNWDFVGWVDWPNSNYNKNCVYNVKAAAFEEVEKKGYTHILWLDSSAWAIKDPNPIFDVINNDGWYIGQSGYNCAQSCSDSCLNYFGITRDEAEKMYDCSSGVLGLNLNNPQARDFFNEWIASAKLGAFRGSRQHDNQSHDTRFLFHRQDQSCASIIRHQLDMKFNGNLHYPYQPEMPEQIIFALRGM